MDVHGQTEASCFASDEIKNVILQFVVFRVVGDATLNVAGINLFRFLARGWLEIERAQIRGFVFDRNGSILFLIEQSGKNHLREIIGERRGSPSLVESFEIALKQFRFKRIEDFSIGSFSGQPFVVKRKQESVFERHPAKTRGIQSAAHHDAIG